MTQKQIVKPRLRKLLWLMIPLGIVGGIAAIGLSPDRQEPAGLVESFTVETAGTPLPSQSPTTTLPGERIPDLGQEHVPETDRITYNSNPPTSGPHHQVWAQWGIYNEAPIDEQLVHNLEHGGVIVSYNPAQIQGDTLEQLRQQVETLSQTNPRIILTPRPTLDAAIALTAWTYLQTLDRYNPAAINAFYQAHIARGSECQQGLCPN